MPVTSIDKIEERLRINFPEEMKASEEYFDFEKDHNINNLQNYAKS